MKTQQFSEFCASTETVPQITHIQLATEHVMKYSASLAIKET